MSNSVKKYYEMIKITTKTLSNEEQQQIIQLADTTDITTTT